MKRNGKEFALFGGGLFGDPIQQRAEGMLASQFLVPPFTVLDARQGFWQKRKRAWLRLGIQSELGRGEALGAVVANVEADNIDYYAQKRALEAELKRSLSTEEATRRLVKLGRIKDAGRNGGRVDDSGNSTAHDRYPYFAGRGGGLGANDASQSGTSVFDPVLCELAYRWFCPPGGQVIDPFAGGSVRGVVAACLGYRYWGCDLSAAQIIANEAQRFAFLDDDNPTWVAGDSRREMRYAPEADFLFTCPPYGDLEQYSDDPNDISTMGYDDFLEAYTRILRRSVKKLRDDRFACIVVGNFRNRKTGLLRGFVGETVSIFEGLGLGFYNEAILVAAVGSLPIRVRKQFESGRKLGKTHQSVLVFVKGDAKRASREVAG